MLKNRVKTVATVILLLLVSQTACTVNDKDRDTSGDNSSLELLLGRLNDSCLPEELRLDTVNNSLKAGILLDYFRTRNNVSHPIKREDREASKGNIASKSYLEVANDALNHTFVGQPSYPRFFCGEDINWGFRPVPDNEWVWQLNRMTFWNAMARAYWHTGDEKYAEAWVDQMMDWVKKNPNDESHEYAWRSIEAGIRGYLWVDLFQHFIDSPNFTPEALVVFLNSLYDHASYLMTKYSSSSNWALMEAEGMAFIAIFFPEFKDSDQWRREAIRRLTEEIDIQVYPDGHQRELTMGYHIESISWFLRTYELAAMNGFGDAFPKSYIEKVEKMCEVPMKLCFPDGTNVQFGDAWEGNPGQHNALFRRWADLFGREDFLYLGTNGKEGKAPDSTSYALPTSGFYSMRSGWTPDAVCMVLKCGPDGGWHSQPDNGTFSLYAGGRTLMPDAGCYIYSGDPEGRAWFRQTRVHQTLTLNGENSNYNPRLLLWQPGEDLDVLVVENGSYDNLTHRRTLFFVDKKYFVIVDDAIGNVEGEVAIHFQLAPGDAMANPADNSISSCFTEGWNVRVQSQSQPGMRLLEEEGWVSFKYSVKEPRPEFSYVINKTSSQPNRRFITLVVPYENEPPVINLKSISEFQLSLKEMELELEENGMPKKIGFKIN
jgi:heparan-sulfate lyase